jgi:hypothetical protein
MDDLSLFAGPGGFFIGMLVWSRILRWGLSLWTVAKERQRDPVHRSRWRIVAAVLLHSGPWTLAALVTGTVLVFRSPHAHAWNVFFYGLLASALFQGVMMAWILRRIRKRKVAGTGHEEAETRSGYLDG